MKLSNNNKREVFQTSILEKVIQLSKRNARILQTAELKRGKLMRSRIDFKLLLVRSSNTIQFANVQIIFAENQKKTRER